jgi:hypothetical protein
MLVLHRAFDETELRRTGFDRLGDLSGVANREANPDLRESPAKRDKSLREPVARDGLARLYSQSAPLQAAEFTQRKFGHLRPGQDRPGLRQEHTPGLRQLDMAADAVEQPRVMPRLERRDRVTGRRLREVQRPGGLRHVLALGDRDKDSQLLQRHALSPRSIPRRRHNGGASEPISNGNHTAPKYPMECLIPPRPQN